MQGCCSEGWLMVLVDGRGWGVGGGGRAGGALAARTQAMMSWEVWETSQDAVHG